MTQVLIARKGKIVYNRCTGKQRIDAYKDACQESLYRWFSMTKPIVSVALMMLVEEGKVLLDHPAHIYLGPSWKKKNMSIFKSDSFQPAVQQHQIEECDKSITVKMLLTHTSGISYGLDPLTNNVDKLMYINRFMPYDPLNNALSAKVVEGAGAREDAGKVSRGFFLQTVCCVLFGCDDDPIFV